MIPPGIGTSLIRESQQPPTVWETLAASKTLYSTMAPLSAEMHWAICHGHPAHYRSCWGIYLLGWKLPGASLASSTGGAMAYSWRGVVCPQGAIAGKAGVHILNHITPLQGMNCRCASLRWMLQVLGAGQRLGPAVHTHFPCVRALIVLGKLVHIKLEEPPSKLWGEPQGHRRKDLEKR